MSERLRVGISIFCEVFLIFMVFFFFYFLISCVKRCRDEMTTTVMISYSPRRIAALEWQPVRKSRSFQRILSVSDWKRMHGGRVARGTVTGVRLSASNEGISAA